MAQARSDINMMQKKAAAYLRVSTEEQAKEGYSLPVQKKMAEEYATKYNLVLHDNLIIEEVMPASKIEQKNTNISLEDSLKLRPKLKDLLDSAQRKDFTDLIVLSRDRLARDFEQFLAIKFILNKNNIRIHYSKEGENFNSTDEKINRFLDNILANVAELESNVISSRVKSGMRLLVDRGLWPGGRAPLGYTLIDKKTKQCKLKPLNGQKEKVQEVFNFYKMGYSYNQIAQMMNEKYNVDNWKKGKVEGIIKNQTYTGHIYWDRRGGRRHPGKHEESIRSRIPSKELCYITNEEWDVVKELRINKVALKDPKYLDTPFLFKDKLVCGICKKRMITKNYGTDKNGKERRVYKCATISDKKSELILPKDLIESMVIEQLKVSFSVQNLGAQWTLYHNRVKEKQAKTERDKKECLEYIETIDGYRKNIREIYKENLNEDILERIEFQDELLLKTKQKYESDLIKYDDNSNLRFISCKEEFEQIILGLINNFFGLDTTQHERRMLITLLVDEIIVSKSGDKIETINLNRYPYNPL